MHYLILIHYKYQNIKKTVVHAERSLMDASLVTDHKLCYDNLQRSDFQIQIQQIIKHPYAWAS